MAWGTRWGQEPLVTTNTSKPEGWSSRPRPPLPPQHLAPGSPASSPISSSSEVIDLERKEMVGGGSRLACWGAGKK